MFPVKSWKNFQNSLNLLNENSKPTDVLDLILNLLNNNEKILHLGPFAEYGLFKYVGLDKSRYPLAYSTMHGNDILHFKNLMQNYGMKDGVAIAMFLRDTIESIILYEKDNQCSACDSWGMQVYKNEDSFCYLCKTCVHAERADGSPCEGTLTFPTTAELKEAGIIQH